MPTVPYPVSTLYPNNGILTYTQKEIEQIMLNERERFELKYPKVAISNVTVSLSDAERRFGAFNRPSFSEPFYVNADFDFNRKIWEYVNGVRQPTNMIEIILCQKQILDLGVSINVGDMITINDQNYLILKTTPSGMLQGTDVYKYLVLTIDLKRVIAD